GESDHYWRMGAGYEWDTEGRMTSLTHPVVNHNDDAVAAGPKDTYTYDAMGRLSGMSGGGVNATATYGVAGEMLGLSYNGLTETRTYNSMLQLTRQTVTGAGSTLMDMQYLFAAGANNGRIASSVDGVLGETVNYTYDSLNRLTLAETVGSGGWGQGFTYDGFG